MERIRNLQRLIALRQAEQGRQGSYDLLWLVCRNVQQLCQVFAAVLRNNKPSSDTIPVLLDCPQATMHVHVLACMSWSLGRCHLPLQEGQEQGSVADSLRHQAGQLILRRDAQEAVLRQATLHKFAARYGDAVLYLQL
jgi:hypothetical protein